MNEAPEESFIIEDPDFIGETMDPVVKPEPTTTNDTDWGEGDFATDDSDWGEGDFEWISISEIKT